MILVVKDIDVVRDDLINRGVDVGEVQEMKPPGFDAPGRSCFARASFSSQPVGRDLRASRLVRGVGSAARLVALTSVRG
jgi:hypothetical protein